MRFITKIFHPTITFDGRHCLDILGDKWSPALQIKSCLLFYCKNQFFKGLLSLQVLLATPDALDFLNWEVAQIVRSDAAQFERIAREWVVKYAQQ
jgi:ubiquitin-conjugating enzyme E2 N